MSDKQKAATIILIPLAAFGLFLTLIYSRPTYRPARPDPTTPRPTATPIRLIAEPGAEIRAISDPYLINCILEPGQQWRPIRYEAIKGKLYVLADAGGSCYGWMIDPTVP